MSAKVILSDNLVRLAKGTGVFEVRGRTVGECLNDLLMSVPALKGALFYETHLDQSVAVLLNNKSVEGRDRLTSAVEEGDVIHIKLERH